MTKKIIKMTEGNLRKIVQESVEKVLNEEPALALKYYAAPQAESSLITEMARLNNKDDSQSPFPSNKYRIWVQGDNSPHKPPHMHILFPQDKWQIKVYINNGQLWQVVSYGNRSRKDQFADIIKMVQEWFQMDTRMPGRIGTNQEAALYEWEACNDI